MGVNGDWEGFGACGWAVYGGVCCYLFCCGVVVLLLCCCG